jgi:hypothetical protein
VIKTQKAGDFSPASITQTNLKLLTILLDARGAQAGKAVTLD